MLHADEHLPLTYDSRPLHVIGLRRYNRAMTYRDRLRIAFAFFACLSVAACGSSAKKPPPANLDEFIDRFYSAVCQLYVTCGDMPDTPTCVASLQVDTTEILTVKADIASGKVRFDRAKAGACLDYVERVYGADCTQTALAALDITGNDACSEDFIGTVADGGACFESFECVSRKCDPTDDLCAPEHQCCAGTCVPQNPPIPVGGGCVPSSSYQLCESGTVCIPIANTLSGTCVAPSKVRGTPCTGSYNCAAPLFCDIDVVVGAGTCQPAVATGAHCNVTVGLSSCNDLRDYCSWSTGTCTPRGAVGAPCSESDANSCLGYGHCVASTCVARSTERGACDPVAGLDCLGGLDCSPTTNTCEFPANAPACGG